MREVWPISCTPYCEQTMKADFPNRSIIAVAGVLMQMALGAAAIRLATRMFTTLPPFPPTMSRPERFVATASERLLYTLMFALPLVGWGMLSAGHYPIVMYGPLHLAPILPANPALYAVL